MRKNGFILPIIMLVLAILVLVGYLFVKSNSGILNKSKTLDISSNSVAGISNLPVELKDVPVYPNSFYDPKYDKKEFYSPNLCGRQILCKVTSYEFGTKDSTDDIFSWYKTQLPKGWEFISEGKTTNGQYQNSYWGSIVHDNEVYIVNIDPSYQNSYGDKHNSTIIKPGPQFDWPVATQAETSGWYTFTDKSGLFTFKYPQDMPISGEDLTPSTNHNSICPDCGGLVVIVVENIDNLSSEKYGLNAEKGDMPVPVVIKNKPGYFAGLDTTIFYGMGGAGTPGPNAYIKRNGKIIVFRTEGIGVERLNKVLSTIKFLN